MSAIHCPPSACSDAPPYVSFYGGTEASWQQLTSEDHPCRVGFPCVFGGLPATVWTGEPTTPAIDHPIHPIHPDHPDHPIHPVHPPHPGEVPEPGTWVLVGAALAWLGLRRRK